jgi:drug/metabolite transporter (DMT)-like permease
MKGARPTRTDLAVATFMGFLMIGLASGGVVLACQHLDSSTAALIQASIPMWVALGGRAFYRNKLGPSTIAGLLLGFAGIVVLVGGGSGNVSLLWAGIIMLASIAWASGILVSRSIPMIEDGALSVGLQLSIGSIPVIVAGILNGDLAGHEWDHITRGSVLAWLDLTLFVSLLAYCVFMWILPRAPANLLATANYIDPIVTLIAGWLILHEGITGRSLVATAIILAGVVLIVRANPAAEGVAVPPAAVEEFETVASRAG